jgi:putative transposase
MAQKKIDALSFDEKKAMMDVLDATFSIREQCGLLGFNRSSFYYEPMPISEETQTLMNLLDAQHTKTPFYGVRKMTQQLKRMGYEVGRDHVRTLMRTMGLYAIYPGPNTSKKNQAHKIYPYLLREVKIIRPNQVWSADITYIRLLKGFAYLVAIIDWYSRYVLAWKLSNSLDTRFCTDALDEALQYGQPEIFNTDQGSQFTSDEFTGRLLRRGVVISMDGRGRALDNIFVERLWRSVKYEDIYIKGYETIPQTTEGLNVYFPFYNCERIHQSLDYQTPWEVHNGILRPVSSPMELVMV